MSTSCRFRVRMVAPILLAVLAGFACLSANLVASPKDDAKGKAADEPRIVSPPNRSVLLSGNLDIIYRGGEAPLRVDSRPAEWEEHYQSPVRVGHLRLSPGMHQLKVGDRQIEFCVAMNEMEHDGPAEWKIHRIHTMSNEKDRCTECHKTTTQKGRLVVGAVLAPKSCGACHSAEDLIETHDGLVELSRSCQMCHALHGSPYVALLKAPRAEILEKYGAE